MNSASLSRESKSKFIEIYALAVCVCACGSVPAIQSVLNVNKGQELIKAKRERERAKYRRQPSRVQDQSICFVQ